MYDTLIFCIISEMSVMQTNDGIVCHQMLSTKTSGLKTFPSNSITTPITKQKCIS